MSSSEWVDLGSERIEFVASLDRAAGISLFAKDPETAQAKANSDDEYLLTVESRISLDTLPWIKKIKDEEAEFLIILDMSGSMAGTPWSQVQSAAIKMLELVKGNKKISVKIMVYNEKAKYLDLNSLSSNIRSLKDKIFGRFITLNQSLNVASHEIKQLRAGGSTNFVDVFNKVGKRMQDRIEAVQKEAKSRSAQETFDASEKKKMFVIFMTDGHDTCNSSSEIMASKEKLQDIMAKYGEEVIVHVLGFSDQHNGVFLKELSLLGTSDGTYSYVDPRDGNKVLERTLTEVMKATTGLIGKSVYLILRMKNESRFVGDFFGDEEKEIVLRAFMYIDEVKKEAKIVTRKFVRMSKFEMLNLEIEMVRDLLESSKTAATVCSVKSVKTNNDPNLKVTLRKLRAALNMLTTRLGQSADDGSTYKVEEENKAWHAVIEKSHAETRARYPESARLDDDEIKDLCEGIESGLKIFGQAIQRREGESEEVHSKRVMGADAGYKLMSKQFHVKKSAAPNKSYKAGSRSTLQYQEMMSD